jgi:hypothetical protein
MAPSGFIPVYIKSPFHWTHKLSKNGNLFSAIYCCLAVSPVTRNTQLTLFWTFSNPRPLEVKNSNIYLQFPVTAHPLIHTYTLHNDFTGRPSTDFCFGHPNHVHAYTHACACAHTHTDLHYIYSYNVYYNIIRLKRLEMNVISQELRNSYAIIQLVPRNMYG